MNTVAYQILTMLGCLALFLWGMSLMSSSLQKFAGNGLRSFIEKMTFDLIQEFETMGDFMINISQALVGLNV